MNLVKMRIFLSVLAVCGVCVWAQEHNSVPLDHAAYGLIEMGVMRGIIRPPSASKPWSAAAVQKALWEMLDNSFHLLSETETDTVSYVLNTLERGPVGFGWENVFSAQAVGDSPVNVSVGKIYTEGGIGYAASWNVTALGQFMYNGGSDCGYTLGNGGAFSLRTTYAYFGLEGELNLVTANSMQFRLGRIRRDWGPQANGASLFMNAQARPFSAFEWAVSPLTWLDCYALLGALEYHLDDARVSGDGPFRNMLSVLWLEINPVEYVHVDMGGSAVFAHAVNMAFFTNLEFRLPRFFKLWGSLFVDSLDMSAENILVQSNSIFAFQGGLKTVVHWLPFAAFTLRYTKVEPYCYTGAYETRDYGGSALPASFINDGDSPGLHLPPNSDELLLRLESRLSPRLNAWVQYQLMRRGADYGYGAIGGSSLRDTFDDSREFKYFLKDGVYRWDNIIRLGGSWNLRFGAMPVTISAETGFVTRRFTINGKAGVGNEAEYEALDDSVYPAGRGLVFSVGFRLFPW